MNSIGYGTVPSLTIPDDQIWCGDLVGTTVDFLKTRERFKKYAMQKFAAAWQIVSGIFSFFNFMVHSFDYTSGRYHIDVPEWLFDFRRGSDEDGWEFRVHSSDFPPKKVCMLD